MEWSLLFFVVQVAVSHPVDDLGQLADPAQLADYDSGHIVTCNAARGASARARWQGFKKYDGPRRDEGDTSGENVAVQTPDTEHCILGRLTHTSDVLGNLTTLSITDYNNSVLE